MDYGEYTYQEKKRKNEAKKKQHRMEVKEVKFRPNTDDHDYNFKKNHAVRFLKDGNKVKAVVFSEDVRSHMQISGRKSWPISPMTWRTSEK